MDYDTAIKELIEQLSPFFEVAQTEGWSLFDMSRVTNYEHHLDEQLDDNSFSLEVFEKLEDKYNCVVSYESTDMGSYIIRHNDWTFDEWGNATKKTNEVDVDFCNGCGRMEPNNPCVCVTA